MKSKSILFCLPLLALLAPLHAEPVQPQAEDRAAWMDDAKFGLFIHWGLYSELGSGEWLMCTRKIPVAEYEKNATKFNPVKFNADEWVTIAKNAGMKYIVITSKHHEGFAMFGSKVSPYNIVDATPFKRDPLKELAEACRKQGIKLGFYYSHSQDWHYPGGAASLRKGGSWDPAQKGDFNDYFHKLALPQIRELVTGYGPLAILWCDTPWYITPEMSKELVHTVRAVQPATLINSRIYNRDLNIETMTPEQSAVMRDIGVDYLCGGDRQIPLSSKWKHWETCMTLNNSWGYRKTDHNWKTPSAVIHQLVTVVSRGGNFLLNVGPTGEGEFPAESVKTLTIVGDWLKIYGEAIYGATPVSLQPPSALKRRSRGKERAPAEDFVPKDNKLEIPQDWLATGRAGKVYIHLFKCPAGPLVLSGFKSQAAQAFLLADPTQKPLEFNQTGDTLTVHLPEKPLDDKDTVLCVTLK